ncbi:hypothetical protein [Salinispira pacifica]
MRRSLLAASILLILLSPTLFAQALSGRDLLKPSARDAAIGGIHAASAEGLSSLFTNPAGFASTKPTLGIAELNVDLKGPVFTILTLILQGKTNPLSSPVLADLITNLYAGASIVGPLGFGYAGNGLGVGIFNSSDILLRTVSPGNMSLETTERVLISGGYAFRIPIAPVEGSIDIGALLKGFLIGKVTVTGTILDIESLLTKINPQAFLNNPFDLTTGIGLDIGARFSLWNNMLAFGLTGTNIYTPAVTNHYASLSSFTSGGGTVAAATTTVLPINVSAGVEFSPPLGIVGRYINDLTLFFDYRNILDFLLYPGTSENIVLKFSVGAEVRMLEILYLRAGFARGLPAFGFGLDLSIFTLNAAVYGEELSTEPGFKSVYNIMIGLDFAY